MFESGGGEGRGVGVGFGRDHKGVMGGGRFRRKQHCGKKVGGEGGL